MIPQRVKVSGFLSYKEEQDVRFDGAPVWMLAGSNGSGKSSVFDAVTYALFGHHRGGSQNAGELINKDSTSMAVEFDFTLDGRLFRIKRTLRKNARGVASGTQQAFRRNDAGEWESVPDTGKKVDFDKWLHEKIGLNYDTFTSSVLLLQGKAEKLLDSKPSGRAEVLAGIVDLERYQKLHEKANGKKLEFKSRLDALSHQTAAVPDVSDMEFAAADMKIAEAEDARRDAKTVVDGLLGLEAHARRWADVRGRLDTARAKLKQAELLLGEAVRIEAAAARLRELREVVPAANTVATMRGQFGESEQKSERLTRERQEATDRRARADHTREQARKKRAQLQSQLSTDEGKLSSTNARLRELSAVLETVRLVEDQEAELGRLETDLKRLPANPRAEVDAAQAEVDRLTQLDKVLPILERVSVERHALGVARSGEADAKRMLSETRAEGEQLKLAQAESEAEHKEMTTRRSAADGELAVAKALADRATEAVEEFADLAGEKSCRACGQPLTPAHFAEEKARREADLQAAKARHKIAIDTRRDLLASEKQLAEKAGRLQADLLSKREEYLEHNAAAKHAVAEIKRLTDSLNLRYAEMPAPYRGQIADRPPADWATTTFPERDELAGLRRDVEQLPAAGRRLTEAGQTFARADKLNARIESVRQTLSRLRDGLPATDLSAIREEHRTRQADETGLVNSIQGLKKAVLQVETDIDKFGHEAHHAVQVLTDLAGKLNTEEVTRKHCQEAIARALKNLTGEWKTRVERAGMADHMAWSLELDELVRSGTEAKYKQLEIARGGLSGARQEIADLEAEEVAFPDDARTSPDDIKTRTLAARTAFDRHDQEYQDARRHRDVLDGYRKQRSDLSAEFTRIDGLHTKYKLLSELLGRDRLQRHLVRRAERQITDYANSVLDRLSGGQLFLRLVGSDDGTTADKALELECANRVTGSAAINVAFLSGSQRFRVAVSLALAIGQYASKQHRPIESVIIDEGFGCLDRQGRQVMIQELQNLRGHLHCILLVSHQEEFADAFPDGYRFELQNGATRVSRFQR